MIFETHAHYDDDCFSGDCDNVLKKVRQSGIRAIVNVGSSLESCRTTAEIVRKNEDFYGAIGIHPSDTGELNEDNFSEVIKLLDGDRIVAVGEIGLDYHYDEPSKEIQKVWFERQIEIAREKKLPMIIHSREAAKDTYDIMKSHNAHEIGGVIHCYSYSVEMAELYLDMGFFFGIGGVITFKNSKKLTEVVEYLPMSSIVLETDSPYLAPVPNRGQRNDSSNLIYVADKIAQIKGISRKEVEEITWDNACRLYRLENK